MKTRAEIQEEVDELVANFSNDSQHSWYRAVLRLFQITIALLLDIRSKMR